MDVMLQTKALAASVVLSASLCVALLSLSTRATFWNAPPLPVQRSEDPLAFWLGTDHVDQEIFDGERRVSVLRATDVPTADARAIVLAARQGRLLDGLVVGAELYQGRYQVLSIRRALWRLSTSGASEYDAVTRVDPHGRSGAGLRVLVVDTRVTVQEAFAFVHG